MDNKAYEEVVEQLTRREIGDYGYEQRSKEDEILENNITKRGLDAVKINGTSLSELIKRELRGAMLTPLEAEHVIKTLHRHYDKAGWCVCCESAEAKLKPIADKLKEISNNA